MATRSRPRSPDVQIYRPQLTSVLSITHRVTGALLSLGSVLLVIWLVVVASGADSYVALHGMLDSWIGIVVLFGWTFALFFHLCNGIRHLCWDLDYGFELQAIYRSGWSVVATSVVLTLATWVVGLTVIG